MITKVSLPDSQKCLNLCLLSIILTVKYPLLPLIQILFLAYVINNPVDVIFLDIDLKSNINGLSLAETIRKYNKKIFILFLQQLI